MSINETLSRSILSRVASIEPDFWSAYYLDAYEHPHYLFLDPDASSSPIKIKTNAVKLLGKRLASNRRPLRDVVTLGDRGEPYGDLEKHYQLTRGLLELLYHYRYPVHILTASSLILRDSELLQKMARESFVHISVVMTMPHPAYKLFYADLEQEKSLHLLRSLRLALPQAHISAKVLPILPCFGDDASSLDSFLALLKKAGAHSVALSLCDFLETKQLQTLIDTLDSESEEIQRFIERFELEIEEGRVHPLDLEISSKEKQKFLMELDQALMRYQLQKRAPRYLPMDYRYSNYLLAQRLFQRAYAYELQGKNAASIRDMAYEIQAMGRTVSHEELLEFAKDERVKRDINYFLSCDGVKSFGQAKLF